MRIGPAARETTPHCVYRAYDATGQLLYVGCSIRPDHRLREHRQSSVWYPRATRIEREWHPTFSLARSVERAAIDTEGSLFNVRPMEHGRRTAILRMAKARMATT